MKNGWKAGLLVAVLVVVGAVAPAFAGSQVTVGDFYKDIASLKKLPAADAVTAEAALRSAGYSLPALDRNAALTEGAVAQIANAIGARVASSNPTAVFGRGQANRFLTAMGPEISNNGPAVAAWGDDDSDSDSDSGKNKKPPKSPKKPRPPHKPKKPRSDDDRAPGGGDDDSSD
jgi:hypothetical protein